MKKLTVLLFTALLTSSAACSDDDDGAEACEAFGTRCPTGAPNGVTCDADRVNNAANGGEVEDCIQSAADCNAAATCYGTLK